MTDSSTQQAVSTCEFSCHRNRGFHITFSNGWTVSVAFGENNYASKRNYDAGYDDWRKGDMSWRSCDAEVAIIDPTGQFIPFESTDGLVKGWVSPDEVGKIIEWTRKRTP
jgi:hypothetical protein